MKTMKKLKRILFGLLIFITTSSCVKNKLESQQHYNQKANEIIFQIIKESNCNCLLEIPKQSLIKTNNSENPSYDIRNFLIRELKTKNNSNLDSLVSVSKNFKLNTETLKKNNIEIIKIKDIRALKNNNSAKILKMCSKGIICFSKPIFDKTYQKAVLDYGFAFICTKDYPLPIYEFKNGKWNRIKK
jgi:hypothetical protein